MIEVFLKTLRSVVTPSVFLILLTPFLVASFLWMGILFFFWNFWTNILTDTSAFRWMMDIVGDNMVMSSVKVVVVFIATILVFGPLWYLTYILLISAFLFPLLLPAIRNKHYPDVRVTGKSGVWAGLSNDLGASLIFLVVYGLSLPLWFFTPLSPLIHLLITAYLNKKVFSFDVLQDYTTPGERENFIRKNSQDLWVLGVLTALLTWIPLANIFAPAVTALAYIHYCLGKLEAHQKALRHA